MEGNGTFSFGETVTISIDSVASGYEFDSWVGYHSEQRALTDNQCQSRPESDRQL